MKSHEWKVFEHALLYAVMAQYQSLHAVPRFQYGHCMMDEVQVLGVAFNGVQVTSMFELLAELQKPVKEEVVEDQTSPGPRGFDKEQKAFLESLSKKGLRDFDPSYQKGAFSKWQHLLRSVDLKELRHTHAQVSAKFRHGEHQGQRISDLTRQLKEGQVKSQDITPLVCLFWNDVHWVICATAVWKPYETLPVQKRQAKLCLSIALCTGIPRRHHRLWSPGSCWHGVQQTMDVKSQLVADRRLLLWLITAKPHIQRSNCCNNLSLLTLKTDLASQEFLMRVMTSMSGTTLGIKDDMAMSSWNTRSDQMEGSGMRIIPFIITILWSVRNAMWHQQSLLCCAKFFWIVESSKKMTTTGQHRTVLGGRSWR